MTPYRVQRMPVVYWTRMRLRWAVMQGKRIVGQVGNRRDAVTMAHVLNHDPQTRRLNEGMQS